MYIPTSDRIPNCVPEYYRSMLEEDEREIMAKEKDEENYRRNREKLHKAIKEGRYILDFGGHSECLRCADSDHNTMRNADDDFDTVICLNDSCPCHAKYGDKHVGEE